MTWDQHFGSGNCERTSFKSPPLSSRTTVNGFGGLQNTRSSDYILLLRCSFEVTRRKSESNETRREIRRGRERQSGGREKDREKQKEEEKKVTIDVLRKTRREKVRTSPAHVRRERTRHDGHARIFGAGENWSTHWEFHIFFTFYRPRRACIGAESAAIVY